MVLIAVPNKAKWLWNTLHRTRPLLAPHHPAS